jgi:hypothetical protein
LPTAERKGHSKTTAKKKKMQLHTLQCHTFCTQLMTKINIKGGSDKICSKKANSYLCKSELTQEEFQNMEPTIDQFFEQLPAVST